MESILVINAGSTSIKYKLYTYSRLEEMQAGAAPIDHKEGVERAFKQILRQIGDLSDLKAVGHRIVHGGDEFFTPTLVENSSLRRLEPLSQLAPLHNPNNIGSIKAALEYITGVPNVMVFDTAWYHDMPPQARYYPLSLRLQDQFKIKRYGFHGISHQYAAEAAVQDLQKKLVRLNAITIHLGGGCSMTAVRKGKAIDTSMGFTPLEGLMMQSRAGSIDPGIILYLAKQGVDVDRLLNFESGIVGVSGCRNYLELLSALKARRHEAVLAYAMFIERIRKQLAGFVTLFDSIDAVVFTGMIGAGDERLRKDVVKGMERFLGPAKTLVVIPNEEQVIARETKRIIEEAQVL